MDNYHPLNEDDSLKCEVYNQDIESDNNVVLGMIEIVPSQEELHNPAQYTQCLYETQCANDVKEQSPNRCADDSKQILTHCADNPPPSQCEDPTESVGEGEEDNPNPTSPLEDPTESVGEGEEDNPPTSPLEDPTESVGEGEGDNPNPTSQGEDPTETVGEGEEDNPPTSPFEDTTESVGEGEGENPTPSQLETISQLHSSTFCTLTQCSVLLQCLNVNELQICLQPKQSEGLQGVDDTSESIHKGVTKCSVNLKCVHSVQKLDSVGAMPQDSKKSLPNCYVSLNMLTEAQISMYIKGNKHSNTKCKSTKNISNANSMATSTSRSNSKSISKSVSNKKVKSNIQVKVKVKGKRKIKITFNVKFYCHVHAKFKCNLCSNIYETRNSCYKHVCTYFAALYKCKICGKGFQYPTLLASHNLLHTRKLLIKCKVSGCKKKYALHSALENHKLTHKSCKFQCLHCNFVTVYKAV